MCERYKDVTSVISYVRKEIGAKEFEAKFGKWSHSEYSFNYDMVLDSVYGENWYTRRKPVELGEYTVMLPQEAYQYNFNGQTVTITMDENTDVLEYPIRKIVSQDTMLLHHPEQLLTYRNDSLMLVLEGFCIKDTVVTDVSYIQKKKKKGR